MKRNGPRTAFLDIETAPLLIAAWGMFEQNAVWVERDTYILAFSVWWSDEQKVRTYALPDYPGYKRNKHDDKHLARDLWKILNEADLICAHNGDQFDLKKINSRLAVHGFTPPAPYKSIDTLKMARRHFKFDSNKLDNLARYLGIGRKLPNTGAALWRGCINDDDPKSWRIMKRYCGHDTWLLRGVYEKLKCWSPTHPDLRPYAEVDGCPTCMSVNIQRRGVSVAKSRKYQRFQCNGCGSWFSGKSVVNDKAKR
jgi:uncharacterized protein YprB with RNaseH-like and TPR domain